MSDLNEVARLLREQNELLRELVNAMTQQQPIMLAKAVDEVVAAIRTAARPNPPSA